MTNKKKRQRGSRTHGGGSQKNRRGAGNRGGKGNAGRSKHEHHNHEPLGKEGFTPPPNNIDREVVNLDEVEDMLYKSALSEDAPDGLYSSILNSSDSSETEFVNVNEGIEICIGDLPHRIDLAQIYEDADVVKLLAGGSVNSPLEIRTDDCSDSAKIAIISEGGRVYLTRNNRVDKTKTEKTIARRYNRSRDKTEPDVEQLKQYLQKVESEEKLEFHQFDNVIQNSVADPEIAYEIMLKHAELIENPTGIDIINIIRSREFAKEYEFDTSYFDNIINTYFEDIDTSEKLKELIMDDLPDSLNVDMVLDGIDQIHTLFEDDIYDRQEEFKK